MRSRCHTCLSPAACGIPPRRAAQASAARRARCLQVWSSRPQPDPAVLCECPAALLAPRCRACHAMRSPCRRCIDGRGMSPAQRALSHRLRPLTHHAQCLEEGIIAADLGEHEAARALFTAAMEYEPHHTEVRTASQPLPSSVTGDPSLSHPHLPGAGIEAAQLPVPLPRQPQAGAGGCRHGGVAGAGRRRGSRLPGLGPLQAEGLELSPGQLCGGRKAGTR